MKKGFLFICLVLSACSNNTYNPEERWEATVKLCHSDSAKAFSHTADGLRIMCQDGSAFIIRDELSIEDIVELDNNYCASMGIMDFVSSKEGKISLQCKDGSNYQL